MIIQVLCDNPNSWMTPYAKEFTENTRQNGFNAVFTDDPESIIEGDILIMLSCEKIFRKLYLNKHNLVVHESDLPKGKGWSPLTWQVLEGKLQIPVTLFEASESIDDGPIYDQKIIELTGTELIDELREKQAKTTIELLDSFILQYPYNVQKPQQGESNFYPKRTQKDSELSIDKTIAEQFNLLRVCDNERYPAFFEMNGYVYFLKIEKKKD